MTKSNLVESYSVKDMVIIAPIPTSQVFSVGVAQIQADKYNLPSAVVRQAVHFGSDYFTKQGLPLPFVSTINNDLSKSLMTNFNVDMWSVTRGAAVAVLINSLIAYIHQLFCDPSEYGSRKLYEVKTRKILKYSNLIASASNVIYVAISKDMKKLDVGGLIVTIYRLITDTKFIRQVKEDFIFGSYKDMIMGDDAV